MFKKCTMEARWMLDAIVLHYVRMYHTNSATGIPVHFSVISLGSQCTGKEGLYHVTREPHTLAAAFVIVHNYDHTP